MYYTGSFRTHIYKFIEGFKINNQSKASSKHQIMYGCFPEAVERRHSAL